MSGGVTADSALSGVAPPREEQTEQRVTPLELFFDLVFVFALTRVTAYLAEEPTFEQLARGVLILGALWWAWVGYAWLTNRANSDDGLARVVLLCAMAAMLVAALAVPGAFGADATVFAVAYALVRAIQTLALFLLGDREPEVRRAITRLAVSSSLGPALILVACAFDGPVQGALWVVALVIDYGGALLATRAGGHWRVHAGHFAERHALIVIIALGESIVALGAGAEALDLGAGVIAGAVLGIALAGALWWAYFDVVAIVAEHRLAGLTGAERGAMARDSYSYLHFVMVAGIVLMALGVKKTLADVDDPLKAMPAVCLFGGIAVYYVGHVLFRLRNVRSLSRPRGVAIAVLIVLAVFGTEVDALVALALASAVAVSVVTYEAIVYAAARDRIRHALRA